MEAEAGVKHFEDGGRGHKPKLRVPLENGKGRKLILPRGLQKELALPTP